MWAAGAIVSSPGFFDPQDSGHARKDVLIETFIAYSADSVSAEYILYWLGGRGAMRIDTAILLSWTPARVRLIYL